MRIGDAYLMADRLGSYRVGDVGPQVTGSPAGEVDQCGAVARVRQATSQPAVDRLRVDTELSRDIDRVQADAAERARKRMLHRRSPVARYAASIVEKSQDVPRTWFIVSHPA
jgi:hypothetical protein